MVLLTSVLRKQDVKVFPLYGVQLYLHTGLPKLERSPSVFSAQLETSTLLADCSMRVRLLTTIEPSKHVVPCFSDIVRSSRIPEASPGLCFSIAAFSATSWHYLR